MKLMIKDIKPNKFIVSYFILDSFYIKENKDYTVINLKDKSGYIKALIRKSSPISLENIKSKSLIRIAGETKIINNSLLIDVKHLRKAQLDEINKNDFIEVVKEGVDYWYEKLLELINLITDINCKTIINSFLSDQNFVDLFKNCPAGVSHHHNYIGGLLEHTVNTMSQLFNKAKLYEKDYDKDILLTGAFLHDIWKVRELKIDINIYYSEKGRYLGHIPLGIMMLNEKLSLLNCFPKSLASHLQHIILSHHGKLEYGSIIEPKTPEAIAISVIEGSDAKINGFLMKNKQKTYEINSGFNNISHN